MFKFRFILLLGFFIYLPTLQAKENNQFEKLFSHWAYAFNHKKLTASCALFSPAVIADYQGVPQKSYATICNGFEKIFREQDRHYHYNFKIHRVYQSEDLAAVRITWYLKVTQNGKLLSRVQDEGLDVLQKNHAGKWQIIEYLAFAKN